MQTWIIFVSWLLFFGYWAFSGRRAKALKRVEASGGGALWLLGVIAVFVVLLYIGPSFSIDSMLLHWLFAAIVVLGAVIAVWARAILATNWSKDVALTQGQELITAGPYSAVRHPIYTGFLLMYFGTSCYSGRYFEFVLLAIFFVFLRYKWKEEERLLAKEFARDYPAYRLRTKAIIPLLY